MAEMVVYMTGFCTNSKPIQDTLGQDRTVLVSGVLISRVKDVLYHRTVNHLDPVACVYNKGVFTILGSQGSTVLAYTIIVAVALTLD